MSGESRKKLIRAQRAECRTKAKSGISTAELARIYKCSTSVIRSVVNNSFRNPDNVDSDVDYPSSELPMGMDRDEFLEALGMTIPYQNALKEVKERLAAKAAKKASAAKHTSHDSVGEEAQEEASSSKSIITPPESFYSAVRKRKPDEEEDAEPIPSTSKAARMEGSDTARRRLSDSTTPTPPVSSSSVSESCGAGGSRNEQMECDSRTERREVDNIGAAQLPKNATAKVISPMISRPRQAPTSNVRPADNLPSSPAQSVDESPGTSPSTSTASSPAPAILPATAGGNAAVASFLSSQGRNLSRLQPTFIELGIKNDADIASLRSVPREENKKWFKELSGESKMTPLEIHILLCAIHV